MIIIENEKQFEEIVKNSQGPVMIDFYADWCGPCKAMAPMLEAFAKAVPECVVGKVNVEEIPEVAQRYKIISIPTIMLFQGGECKARKTGLMQPKDLEMLFQESV